MCQIQNPCHVLGETPSIAALIAAHWSVINVIGCFPPIDFKNILNSYVKDSFFILQDATTKILYSNNDYPSQQMDPKSYYIC